MKLLVGKATLKLNQPNVVDVPGAVVTEVLRLRMVM